MALNNNEILVYLKDLKYHSRELNQKLESSGLYATDGAVGKEKSVLFDSNINDITTAIEGLLRGESPERHAMRLQKAIPEAKRNISKILQTNPGRLNVADLGRLKEIIEYFEQNYKNI